MPTGFSGGSGPIATGLKFLGASVVGFNSIVGYNNSSSNVSIEIVEDIKNGDSIISGIVGTPYHFAVSGFIFDGLLRSFETAGSQAGNPLYNAVLTSPLEILDGVKIITGEYNGGLLGSVDNLFSPYGLYENSLGFGGALSNNTGMYWQTTAVSVSGNPHSSGSIVLTSGNPYGIKPGVELIQTNSTAYGSGIFYRGYTYQVNLSGLHATLKPPSYYKLGGAGAISLRECIETLCKDAGSDYICSLQVQGTGIGPHIINITPVLLLQTPQFGKIQQFVDSQSGIVTRSLGKTMQTDETSFFMVGSPVQSLFQQSTPGLIAPFWGINSNGFLVIGAGTGDNYTAYVDATSIIDIVGPTYGNLYPLTQGELRFALASFDGWAGYLSLTKPTLAANIGLQGIFSANTALAPVFSWDFVNNVFAAANAFGSAYSTNLISNAYSRLFNFVKNYATQYYGKKFLVQTPTNVLVKVDPDTSNLIYSWEPCEGAWMDAGFTPLGLSPQNQDYFQNANGTFNSFLHYNNVLVSGDLTSISSANAVLQGSDLFLPCRVMDEYGVMYLNTLQPGVGNSFIAVEVENPLYEIARDPLGGIDHLSSVFGVNMQPAADVRAAYINAKIFPGAFQPVGVAFPMKSNQFTYGPWFISGPPGSVRYEQNQDLNPWSYGSYNTMNLIANAIVSGFVVSQQVQEVGSVQVAGFPVRSLGDAISSGGPIVSDINFTVGSQGVTTTYNMHTYKPSAMRFSLENAKRLQRLGLSTQALRKSIRQIYRNIFPSNTFSQAQNYQFMANVSNAVKMGTPLPVMMSYLMPDPRNSGLTQVPMTNIQTHAESVANIRADTTGIYQYATCAGLETLFRGAIFGSGSTLHTLPKFERPNSLVPSTAIGVDQLNPYPNNAIDYQWGTWGNSYSGLHLPQNNGGDYTQARGIAHKAPLVLTGPTYNLGGLPVPNSKGDTVWQSGGSTFEFNYLNKSIDWKTGPLATFWDDFRKVHTIPTMFKGQFLQTIGAAAGGYTSGLFEVYINNQSTGYRLTAYNDMNAIITSGVRGHIMYDQQENKYFVINVSC